MGRLSKQRQESLRIAAFDWLNEQEQARPHFTRAQLSEGFEFLGQRISLMDRYGRGIHNPNYLDETLSITSMLSSPYDDTRDSNGMMDYAYERSETGGGSNIKLRAAFASQVPIIHFEEFEKSRYIARYPVFVVGDSKETHFFKIDLRSTGLSAIPDELELEKAYADRTISSRVHQPKFRARVISAYNNACAICNLQHVNLLDAAHILPDRDERSTTEVNNGLALCKIHHAAYDRNVIGITPASLVIVSPKVLAEVDGPMLEYGIKAMHQRTLRLPNRDVYRPNTENLEIRYQEFLSAS